MKHYQQLLFSLLFIVFSSTVVFAQPGSNPNHLYWSATRKLNVEDFLIKTGELKDHSSMAQYMMEFQVHGFDFMTRNFNKKVKNYMIKSASWIDTTHNLANSLRYQQALFDLHEVYTRRFRKLLKENRGKIASGVEIAQKLNDQATTDLANRRIELETDTRSGTDMEKLAQWEIQILVELKELKAFAAE